MLNLKVFLGSFLAKRPQVEFILARADHFLFARMDGQGLHDRVDVLNLGDNFVLFNKAKKHSVSASKVDQTWIFFFLPPTTPKHKRPRPRSQTKHRNRNRGGHCRFDTLYCDGL